MKALHSFKCLIINFRLSLNKEFYLEKSGNFLIKVRKFFSAWSVATLREFNISKNNCVY